MIDLNFVRQQFPALATDEVKNRAFFDNAAGSYMCKQVIDRFNHFFLEHKVQPYGFYQTSKDAGDEMDLARSRLAKYLNVGFDEVKYGPSTSQNTYVLAAGLLARIEKGDNIIVTGQEHEANSGVWRRLADHGIIVKEWHVNPETGLLNSDDLDDLLDTKTRLVAMTHCSNVVAEIHDIPAIAEKIHGSDALLLVDGVSFCPHGLPDVDALGADVYLFSTYKTFGPHQGAMVMREHARERFEPQSHFFNHGNPYHRLLPAGPDHAQVAAANGMFDYFDALDAHHGGGDDQERPRRVEKMMRRAEIANLQPMLDYLAARNDVRLIGPKEAEIRAATVSFTSNQRSSSEIATALAEEGIMVGAGDFYATRLVQSLGVDLSDGVVRLSFVHYTSPDEIKQALTALDHIL